MSRRCLFALFATAALLSAVPAMAQESPDQAVEDTVLLETAEDAEAAAPAEVAAPAEPAVFAEPSPIGAEQEIPDSIRNNQYFLESQRLAKLAHETYQYGDYDLSASLSEEAIRYAELSDEYVARQLKILAANEAIAAARRSLDWASSSGAARQYSSEYSDAEAWYNRSLAARTGEDWDDAYNAARRAIDIMSVMRPPAAVTGTPVVTGRTALPATYTVRPWGTSRDCFWNIAARPWVYGDGRRWRVLYEANRSKLPEPGNPNLIEPGMVIEIPSIRGEIRQGAWDPSRVYTP